MTDNGRQGHTPGPWAASEMGTDRSFWDALAADDVRIIRTNWDGFTGDVIAAVWADDDSSDAANAAFIVRACNSHYALLDALKEARGYISNDVLHRPKAAALVRKCDAAIRLAHGEEQ